MALVFGQHENPATQFSLSKCIKGFKLGRHQAWAAATSATIEKIEATIILALGSRGLSGQIHINLARRHENSASGCIVTEKVLFELSTVQSRRGWSVQRSIGCVVRQVR